MGKQAAGINASFGIGKLQEACLSLFWLCTLWPVCAHTHTLQQQTARNDNGPSQSLEADIKSLEV